MLLHLHHLLHSGSSKFGVTRSIFSQSIRDEVQYKKSPLSNNAWAIYTRRLARSKGRVPSPLLIPRKEDNLLLAIFLRTAQHPFLLLLSKVERTRPFDLACSPEYGLYVTWFPRNRMSRDSHVTISNHLSQTTRLVFVFFRKKTSLCDCPNTLHKSRYLAVLYRMEFFYFGTKTSVLCDRLIRRDKRRLFAV